jgi:outer membrane protein assembly factor BamB
MRTLAWLVTTVACALGVAAVVFAVARPHGHGEALAIACVSAVVWALALPGYGASRLGRALRNRFRDPPATSTVLIVWNTVSVLVMLLAWPGARSVFASMASTGKALRRVEDAPAAPSASAAAAAPGTPGGMRTRWTVHVAPAKNGGHADFFTTADTLYVTDWAGRRLEAHDMTSGKLRWAQPDAFGVVLAAFDDGEILVYQPAETSSPIVAVNASGDVRWRKTWPHRLLVVEGGPDDVLLQDDDDTVSALDRKDGATRWSTRLPSQCAKEPSQSHVTTVAASLPSSIEHRSFTVAGERLLVRVACAGPACLNDAGPGCARAEIHALDPASGAPRWHRATLLHTDVVPLAGDVVLDETDDPQTYPRPNLARRTRLIDPRTGEVRADLGRWSGRTVAFTPSGLRVVEDDDRHRPFAQTVFGGIAWGPSFSMSRLDEATPAKVLLFASRDATTQRLRVVSEMGAEMVSADRSALAPEAGLVDGARLAGDRTAVFAASDGTIFCVDW